MKRLTPKQVSDIIFGKDTDMTYDPQAMLERLEDLVAEEVVLRKLQAEIRTIREFFSRR